MSDPQKAFSFKGRGFAPNFLIRASVPELQMCMGMGKTGIPWVPWDSHGNKNMIRMGMRWEWD